MDNELEQVITLKGDVITTMREVESQQLTLIGIEDIEKEKEINDIMLHDIVGSSLSEIQREISVLMRMRNPKYNERIEELAMWEYKIIRSFYGNTKRIRKMTHGVFKEIVQEEGNGEYYLFGRFKGYHSKVRLYHTKCRKTYETTPAIFRGGSGCPNCNMSHGERKIERYLSERNLEFTTEKTFEGLGKFRFDFYVHGVAIEYDGVQHYEPVDHFGGERALRETQRRDRIKDKYCADNGIPLIRIPYWEYDNIDAILTEKLLPLIYDNKDVDMTQEKVS